MIDVKLKKLLEKEDNTEIKGGKADKLSVEDIAKKHNVSVDVIQKQIDKGIPIEHEHVGADKAKAREICMDHLIEFPDYYDRLIKMEEEGKAALNEAKSDFTTGPGKPRKHLSVSSEVKNANTVGDQVAKAIAEKEKEEKRKIRLKKREEAKKKTKKKKPVKVSKKVKIKKKTNKKK